MECLNCKSRLQKMPSNGVEGKYILADLQPHDESGYRKVKDGIVVDLFYCSNCGLVHPKLPKQN